MKLTISISRLISRVFFLVFLGAQGVLYTSMPRASAPPAEDQFTTPVPTAPPSDEEEKEAEKKWLEFKANFIAWDDIFKQNPMEKKFNDTLSDIKAVNIQDFHALIEQLRKSQDEFGYIPRAYAENLLSTAYKKAKFILWSDIQSGKETFDGKLSHLKQKYPRDYATLEKALQNLKKEYIDAIVRDDATRLVTEVYDRVAFMKCEDMETNKSLSDKWVYIRKNNELAYNELKTSLLKDCKDGRILKDKVESRVHAVYIRTTLARLSAASFYYAKSFAQTTYIFLAEYVVPGVSYVFSNSYAYMKKYGAQVVERGQRGLEQWRKESAARRKQIRQVQGQGTGVQPVYEQTQPVIVPQPAQTIQPVKPPQYKPYRPHRPQ